MKNIVYKLLLLMLCICFLSNAFSQVNVKIDTKQFKENKDVITKLKQSESLFKLANTGAYAQAVVGYYSAYEYTQNNAQLNYKLGICCLYSSDKSRAETILKQAKKINPNVAPDLNYFIGYSLFLNGQYDEAIENYQLFKDSQSLIPVKKQSPLVANVDKRIDECKHAKEMIANPIRVWIDNLGENINSQFSDYGPSFPVDESFMIYTSRRDDTSGDTKIDPNDNQYYEDIYIAYKNDRKAFEKAINLRKLNTAQHDAAVSLSADGQILYTYKGYNSGTLLESKLVGSEWGKVKEVKNINTKKYQESSAYQSNDGKYLYFVSNRPKDDFGNKSLGGLDIFVCEKDKNGKWGKAKNIGAPINTKYDEEGIFIHPNGQQMYFSSKREGSMGGYDIYKSEKDKDGNWKEPENIGYPINTVDDDVFFVVAANPRYAYFSSARLGGYGSHDIYKITFLGPEKLMAVGTEDFLIASSNTTIEQKVKQEEVEVKTVRLTIMKGTVTDALSQTPIEAKIELIDTITNEVINTVTSNSGSGKYLVSFPSGSTYRFVVSAPSYSTYSEVIVIPETAAYQEVTKDFVLTKAGVGSKIVLKNIEFDLAKATLRPTSFPELERLVKLLEAYPSMIIEIGGHTDNTGSKAINEKLSAERAKAVVDYLVEKGIATERLTSAGYADTQPVADNKTEAGRQQNRRVEFKVISMK
ncbi:MAG: OmpA family protein [Bacteroidales bacterium]|jgi:outer membrane protein OmpA-like peptidoglycan-associated protein/tetratricopeptide (TPR) repeat protein|nr:OmpA family protein [Bacteroidales bacterium]